VWTVADETLRTEAAERQFAANLKAVREARGMSQTTLAERMSELGHRWYQSTVTKIEAGRRAVRIGEARDLATILETTVDALSAIGTDEAASIEALTTSAIAVRKAWQQHAESDNAYRKALRELRELIQANREMATRSERVNDALAFAEESLLMAQPDVSAAEPEGRRDVAH
jgi:transcriptional regulator with XRE-family HTH domain